MRTLQILNREMPAYEGAAYVFTVTVFKSVYCTYYEDTVDEVVEVRTFESRWEAEAFAENLPAFTLITYP